MTVVLGFFLCLLGGGIGQAGKPASHEIVVCCTSDCPAWKNPAGQPEARGGVAAGHSAGRCAGLVAGA